MKVILIQTHCLFVIVLLVWQETELVGKFLS